MVFFSQPTTVVVARLYHSHIQEFQVWGTALAFFFINLFDRYLRSGMS